MKIQKMALVPLEVWEEYEYLVENMRSILEAECQELEMRYRETITDLQKDISELKTRLLKKSTAERLGSVFH